LRIGPKTRTNRRFSKTRPDARTKAKKEDVSGETRTYGNPNTGTIRCSNGGEIGVEVSTFLSVFPAGAYSLRTATLLQRRRAQANTSIHPITNKYDVIHETGSIHSASERRQRSRTQPRVDAHKLVKIGRVIPEICSRTDSNTQTWRVTILCSSTERQLSSKLVGCHFLPSVFSRLFSPMSAYSFPFLKSSKGIESSVISTNGVHSESLAALSFIIRPINAEIAT